MLAWIIILTVLALTAGVLGFSSIIGGAAMLAQILFVIFLILLVISLVQGALRSRS